MIELHQYPPAWGLSSLSPFCIKVEVFCNMSEIPYIKVIENNPLKGPKGKMPFIVDENHTIPDSSAIIDYLFRKYGCEQIIDHTRIPQLFALQKMIEESLYFSILYNRWVDDHNKHIVFREFTPLFPKFVGKGALTLIRANLKRQAKAHGIGRHSSFEVYQMALRELKTIESYLSDQRYFTGNRLSSIDATVYSFLVTILDQGIPSEMQKFVQESKTLMAYIFRMKHYNQFEHKIDGTLALSAH